MAIKLYSWPQSSDTRVSWALEELGVGYEYIELDPKKQEHRAPQYLAVNLRGKVPGLADGHLTFFEGCALSDESRLYNARTLEIEHRDKNTPRCWA